MALCSPSLTLENDNGQLKPCVPKPGAQIVSVIFCQRDEEMEVEKRRKRERRKREKEREKLVYGEKLA